MFRSYKKYNHDRFCTSDGMTISTVYEGALNGERFKEHPLKHLVSTLKPRDWVVMDNLSTHKVTSVAELIRGARSITIYLPPYSPDLKAIELMWSKMKAIIRKYHLRTVKELAH